MKFSTFAVLSVVATASAFVPSNNRAFTRQQALYSLSDLEAKLLAPPDAAPKKAAKIEKPKPAPKAKVEKPKPAPKPSPKAKAAPVAAPVPAPVPAPAPVPKVSSAKKSTKSKSGYDLGGVPEKAKKPVKIQSTPRTTPKVEKPKAEIKLPPAPKFLAPKAAKKVAAPKAPVDSDPSAIPLGVVLGGAPLVLAPFVALAAGREFLAKTAARRSQIEEDIAAREAAKNKPQIGADVDGAGLASAAGFLGVAVGALGLILANPLGGEVSMPTIKAPVMTQSTSTSKVPAVSAPKKVAEKKIKKVAKGPYDFEGASAKVENDKEKAAESAADKAAADTKVKAEKEALVKAKKDAATKDAAEKQAAADAKAKEAAAAKEEKASAAAAKKETEAKAALEKAQKTKSADLSKATAAEEKASASAEAEKEKAAEMEADKKSAQEKESKAKEAALKADEKAKEEAAAEKKAETTAAAKKAEAEKDSATAAAEEKALAAKAESAAKAATPAPAPAPVVKAAPAPAPVVKAAPAPAPAAAPKKAGAGLGVVSGSESGGRVLPKEEVSADVLNMLKKYN